MSKLKQILRSDTVLSVAWLLAVLSMLLVPPNAGYLTYIDTHTLALLFCLMAVMAGLQGQGLFRHMGEAMLTRVRTTRQLEAVLIFLPFFSSMLVTNDVALITFVPFALEVLAMAGEEGRTIPVVVMQTIAANLGCMTTPIGNPQNIYLYGHYGLSLGDFFATMLPLTLAAGVLIALFLVLRPSKPLSPPALTPGYYHPGKRMVMYGLLFALSLATVAGVLSVWLLTGLLLAAVAVADRSVLKKVDYALLFTFIGFFLFVGNLGQLPAFRDFFQRILVGNEVICSVLASQVISNVPAALLLSGFTENGSALLIGVNLGGLGTLIASMASLISFKQLTRAHPELRGRYLAVFTGLNLAFLGALYGVHLIL